MAKKIIDTPATNKDMGALLGLIPATVDALGLGATATHKAHVAALRFADATVATFGSLEVLGATSRNKTATEEEKAAYIALKERVLAAIWGDTFLAWVNLPKAERKPTDKPQAPKRGLEAKPFTYWQAQKGSRFSEFVERVQKAVNATKAEEAQDAASKAPNRKATVDERCQKAVDTAIKAMRHAAEAKSDKAEVIPAHVNVAAFLALADLATWALSTSKVKNAKADQVLKMIRQAKIIL